jgi:geranylgeranyl pyrophosphate synthase
VLSVCSGQHLDLSLASPDLTTCWKIAEAKSGAAFSLACYVGTRVATSDTQRLQAMEAFGRHLGTIVQISDDLEDLESGDGEKGNGSNSLIRAFLTYIHEQSQESGEIAATQPNNHDLPRNALILYLRLEAMKYAELARRELNVIRLNEQSRDRILTILNHLSWLGVTTN